MKRFFFSIFLIVLVLSCSGQSISELRERKNSAEQMIRYTSTLLDEAGKDEKSSLNKLKLISSQIQNRNDFIQNINSELALLDEFILDNNEVISMLKNDQAALKLEYASMIRFAQKTRNSYDLLIFLLSSEDMNQAYKRLLYLRQYTSYRKTQAEVISSISVLISKELAGLEEQKQQKIQLIENKRNENIQLEKEKEEQNRYVLSLQRKQQDLRKKLREQEKAQEELNRAIERLLAEETKKSTETGQFVMTPEQKLISADFEKNKGRIPWPVDRGLITEHFGVHAHPVLKQLVVKNNGIDISTQKGSRARAVFGGEVSRVFAISGGNMAVIIRHGSFLTVYSNLKEVYVKAGQKVSLKQEIGSIFTDPNDGNRTVLKFQIWKENQKLDPEGWISK